MDALDSLKELLRQVDVAADNGLFYVALISALAIPDICGALESSDGKATKGLYINWYKKTMGPLYDGFLSGIECWNFRCALVHQGRAHSAKQPRKRILFAEPSNSDKSPRVHRNNANGALIIDVEFFCRDMTRCAREWLHAASLTTQFQRNARQFLQRYPDGLEKAIKGIPVYA